MGTPTSIEFQPAAAIPSGVFDVAADAYEIHINPLKERDLDFPTTSGTPFGLYDGLESYLHMGIDMIVYAKIIDDPGSARIRVDKAYVEAKLLGSGLIDKSTTFGSDRFTVTGDLEPHLLGYPNALTIKTKEPIHLFGDDDLPSIEHEFGPWKVDVPTYFGSDVSVALAGEFSGELSKLDAVAQLRLTANGTGLHIDKDNSYVGLFADAYSTATLTGSVGLNSPKIGPAGPFNLAKLSGQVSADFSLTSYLQVNFDEDSISFNTDVSRAQLDIGYKLKYNLSLLNGTFDTSEPTDPPQIAGKIGRFALFGLKGKQETLKLDDKGNYVKDGNGIDAGDGSANGDIRESSNPGKHSGRNTPLSFSSLRLGTPFHDDLRHVGVDLDVFANTATPSADRHQLTVVLVGSDGSEISLLSRDLSTESFSTSTNPLGFAAARQTLDLPVPADSLDPDTTYSLVFRLTSDPADDGQQVRIGLSKLTIAELAPHIEVTTPGGDLTDGGLDFGPDTAGLSEGIVKISNTGDGQLDVSKLKLSGRGFVLLNAPADGFAIAPGESYDLRVRLSNAAVSSAATLRLLSDDPTTPDRILALRYVKQAVAQQVSFADPTLYASENKPARLKVILARPAQTKLTVNYAVTGGTAIAGTDFKPFDGALTFNPGQMTKYIPVPTLDNKTNEGFRTIDVTLSSPTGAALGAYPLATYVIRDNDPLISFSAATAEGTESNGKAKILLPVELSAVSPTPVTVFYKITGGTANSGKDFILKTGKLTFAAGQIQKDITLTLLPDLLTEGDETITITLFSPVGGLLGTNLR